MFPADIEKLLSHMKSKGISAYVVGGAVRDMMMKRELTVLPLIPLKKLSL